MAALTADRQTKFYPVGDMVAHPVAASTKIYLGSLVCVNASGYAIPGADTAGLSFVGVACETADNSSGSAGDIKVQVRRLGIANFAASGLTQANVNDALYISDDQTVATTTTNSIQCGRLAFFESATEAPVELTRAG